MRVQPRALWIRDLDSLMMTDRACRGGKAIHDAGAITIG